MKQAGLKKSFGYCLGHEETLVLFWVGRILCMEWCGDRALLQLENALDPSINYDGGYFFPVALHKSPEGLCYTYGEF